MPRSPQLLSPQDAGLREPAAAATVRPPLPPATRTGTGTAGGAGGPRAWVPGAPTGWLLAAAVAAVPRRARPLRRGLPDSATLASARVYSPDPIEALLSTAAVQAGVPLGPAMKLPGSPPSPQGGRRLSYNSGHTGAAAAEATSRLVISRSSSRRLGGPPAAAASAQAPTSLLLSPPPGPHAVIARGGVSAALWGTPTAQGSRASGLPAPLSPPSRPCDWSSSPWPPALTSASPSPSPGACSPGANTHGQLG